MYNTKKITEDLFYIGSDDYRLTYITNKLY